MPVQLALLPEPEKPAKPFPAVYWENHGPHQWRPVTVTARYGHCQGGTDETWLPLVHTKPLCPRNVAVRREDGTSDVVPVRNLRRARPR